MQFRQLGNVQFALLQLGLGLGREVLQAFAVRVSVAADSAFHNLAPAARLNPHALGQQRRQSFLHLLRRRGTDGLDYPEAQTVGQLAAQMHERQKIHLRVGLGIVMPGGHNLKVLGQVPLGGQQSPRFAMIQPQRFPLAVQQFENIAAAIAQQRRIFGGIGQ